MRTQAEAPEAVAGTHAVHRQRPVVVRREGLAGQEVHDGCLQAGQRIREADDGPAQPQLVANQRDQFPQREDLRPAQLVAFTRGVVVFQRAHHRGHDVADPDRRQPRLGARQRQRQGHRSQEPGHPVHERVAGAEDHRGLEDRPPQVGPALVAYDPLGLALAAQVVARAVVGVGPEPAHLQQPVDACRPAGRDDLPGQFDMDVAEAGAAAPALVVDADEVDHRIVALEGCGQLRFVMDVAAHDPDRWQHPQVPGAFRARRQDGRAVPRTGEAGAEV